MKLRLAILLAAFLLTSSSPLIAATATWLDNSDNENEFILEGCSGVCDNNSPNWFEVTHSARNTTSLTFTAISLTSYRLFAVNDAGRSGPSNIVFFPALSNAPSSLMLKP